MDTSEGVCSLLYRTCNIGRYADDYKPPTLSYTMRETRVYTVIYFITYILRGARLDEKVELLGALPCILQ